MNKKEKLTKRQRYEQAYRRNRMFNCYLDCTIPPHWIGTPEEAGYESWIQAHMCFEGWINTWRMVDFRGKATYRPEWDGIPF